MSSGATSLIKGLSVFITIMFVSFSTFGQSVTYLTLSSNTENSRHFIQIRHENGSFKAIELDQLRGDYPRILSSRNFRSKIILEKYLSSYLSYKVDESLALAKWPIEQVSDQHYKDIKLSSHKKILGFGHNNKMLWPVTKQWNEKWEEKYAKWIEENVKEDFFKKYGISTDCADAVLGVRWIFSRINGLPVANHISVTDSLFTNYSMPRSFRKLPKAQEWYNDKLFRAALSYVMDLSSTYTLKDDTYPVALTKEGLRAGSLILTHNRESNHAKLISENYFDDPTNLPLFTLASTVPRRTRLLVREVVSDQGWPHLNEKSFLKFRTPILHNGRIYLKSSQSHLDYSLEQYSDRLKKKYPVFIEFLLHRLKHEYDPSRLISMATEDIVNYIEQRKIVVNEGAAFCAHHDCSPNTDHWDTWSTPARDEKLKNKFSNIDLLTAQFEKFSPGLVQSWIDDQVKSRVSILEYSLSLQTIRYLMESGKASYDPSLSIERRWGVDLNSSVSEFTSTTMDLLVKRKIIIESQTGPCSPKDCFPKTIKWLKWNTFKIDEKILDKYREYQKLCEIYGRDTWYAAISSRSLSFDSGTEVLALNQWIERIPFFYSNLDVNKKRRWGRLEVNDRGQILSYEKSITFSDFSTALIDGKILVDLETGENLYNAAKNEYLLLAKNGDLLVQSKNKALSVIKNSLRDSFPIKMELRSLPSSQPVGLKLFHFESTDKMKIIFYYSGNTQQIKTLIYNRQGEILYGPTPALSSQDKDLIFLSKKNILISVKNNMIIDLVTYDKALRILNMKKEHLTPVGLYKDIDSDKILFTYKDENDGVTYPVLFQENKIIPLDYKRSKNVRLKYFDLVDDVFFLEYIDTQEYPQALVTTIVNSRARYENVGNTFSQVYKNKSTYYFSIIFGSSWDQNILPVFQKLDGGTISLLTGTNSKIIFSHLGKEGYFSRGKNIYLRGHFFRFDNLNTPDQVTYPSYIRSDQQLCANTYVSNAQYVEQLNYQHGDYSCFASAYSDESKEKVLFSIKFRTDKLIFSNLINYHHQRLELLGPNLMIWWGKKYK